jgi:hypothetical protein
MSRSPSPLIFREAQRFRQVRVWVLTAILPIGVLLLAIWQVGLGHPFGKTPRSNADIVGWSIFLWIIYLRLVTVKLVTEVGPGQVRIALRGLWRSSLIRLTKVRMIDVVQFDPRDWGGLGIRSKKGGRAYIAGGNCGVQLTFDDGKKALIESQTPSTLARAIREAIQCPSH